MNRRKVLLLVALILVWPALLVGQATVNILGVGTQAITRGALLIPDSYLKLGKGDPNNPLARGDVWLEGDLEVDGAARLDGAVTFNGATSFTQPVVFDANSIEVESISAPAELTITTGTAGDAGLVLPENGVGPDDFAALTMSVILCGELAENGTTYLGPSTGAFGGNGADLSIGSTACDALDNTTEATADAPILTNVPFKVTGLYCKTDGTLGASETLTYTVRSAAADTTPVISCAIATGESDCRSLAGSTTDIAAGATVAVKAVEVSNNADDNGWCVLGIALK